MGKTVLHGYVLKVGDEIQPRQPVVPKKVDGIKEYGSFCLAVAFAIFESLVLPSRPLLRRDPEFLRSEESVLPFANSRHHLKERESS
ncbi:hypothetical protein D3C86_1928820 [compost metagenome]